MPEFKAGDLVVFDHSRMTNRGVNASSWNLDAIMLMLWVPPSDSRAQIALVLMDGVPRTVGTKHLKHIER